MDRYPRPRLSQRGFFMRNSEVDKLYAHLARNENSIKNAKDKKEYFMLIELRKSIIKKLNDLGEVILDDISVSAAPIFEEINE